MLVFDGHELYLRTFSAFARSLVSRAEEAAKARWFLGLTPPLLDPSTLHDDMGSKALGYSFLDDGRNDLKKHEGSMFDAVFADEDLRRRFVVLATADRVVLNHAAVLDYMRDVWEAMLLVLTAFHVGSGNLARGPELASMRIVNNREGQRNIGIFGGHLIACVTRQKSQSLTGHGRVSTFCRGRPARTPDADRHRSRRP